MVIDGLVSQRKEDLEVDIVVCDNVSAEAGRDLLRKWQKEIPGLYLVFTEPRYPMNTCINHAWLLMRGRGYDYYSYVGSDVIHTNPEGFRTLIREMKQLPDCAVMSCQVDIDMNGECRELIKFNPDLPATPLKITQAVNGHFYLYTKEFIDKYDGKKIDVLWGHRLEGFVSYQCAAIRKREYISHKIMLCHWRGGVFNEIGNERLDFPSYDRPYETYGTKEHFLDVVTKGTTFGIGFEELYQRVNRPVPETRMHDPSVYGEDGFPKDDTLYHWIKENLFLTKEQLDYDKIKYEAIL
jgi:hypothetical protein